MLHIFEKHVDDERFVTAVNTVSAEGIVHDGDDDDNDEDDDDDDDDDGDAYY